MEQNSIEKIFKTSGPKSKIIIMVRHGYKTIDNHITETCLNEIIQSGVPGITNRVNVIQHGSQYPRTDETVCAIAINVLRNGGIITKHLPADSRLGNPYFFGLYTKEIKLAMAEKNLGADETLNIFQPQGFAKATAEIKSFIEETFDIMTPGDVCLVPSHTPTVEMAYNAYAFPRKENPKMKIKELEIIFIVQSEKEIDMPGKIFSLPLNYPKIGINV